MSDLEIAALVALGAWERQALATDIGGVADVAMSASALNVVGELLAVPQVTDGDVSEAFDAITYARTIRVSTDLSWVYA